MKISKCKKELARIISENGGWRDGNYAVQDRDDKKVWFMRALAGRPDGASFWPGVKSRGIPYSKVLTNWHQTALSRAEYFHLYPTPDADGWIEWKGGECPVCIDDVVDVMQLDGHTYTARAVNFHWLLKSGSVSVAAYRLHKPDVKPEPCESVTRSIPELEAKPTIEQLAADYRNKLDYANRKQDEADKASMESDAALSQLEDAIAAIGFAITPLAATEQEPEPVIAVQVGDEVECVKPNVKPSKYKGMIGTVLEVDDSSTPYLVDFDGEERIWCHEVKFIRRA